MTWYNPVLHSTIHVWCVLWQRRPKPTMVGQDKRKFEEIHALHCLLKTLETGKT